MWKVETISMPPPKKFRAYLPDQQFLVPPDIRDWVPDDDFARFVDDLVDALDLSQFTEAHKPGTGQPPYDPSMMFRVILYCHCYGICSSRKMERATYRDLGARFLAANQHPDYKSFSNFKKRHAAAMEGAFIQVVALCRQMGLVKLGHVAVDGTVLKANASRTKNVAVNEMDELIAIGRALHDELSKKWAEADFQEEHADDAIPETLKKGRTRLDSLEKAKKRFAELTAEHAAAAELLAEAEAPDLQALSPEAEDEDAIDLREARQGLGLSMASVVRNTGITTSRLSLLENGHRYPSPNELAKLQQVLGTEKLKFRKEKWVPKGWSSSPRTQTHVNTTDPDSCVIGRPGKPCVQSYNAQIAVDAHKQVVVGLRVSMDTHDRRNLIPMLFALEKTDCLSLLKELSADSGYFSRGVLRHYLTRHLDLFIPPERKLKKNLAKPLPEVQAMRDKVSSSRGREVMKTRSSTVEPVFGQWKGGAGSLMLLTRGIANVTAELTWMALAHNAKKMLSRWK